MISKSIVSFWSVLCLMMFYKTGMDLFGVFVTGPMWALVVVPTALIGGLFKNTADPVAQRRADKAALVAGLAAFLLTFNMPNTGMMTPEELRQENLRSQEELQRAKERYRRAQDNLRDVRQGKR